MRTGRPKQPLIVTNEERQRLESLAHRTRSQARLARRARVVLGCAAVRKATRQPLWRAQSCIG
jgi:hypothetical protein